MNKPFKFLLLSLTIIAAPFILSSCDDDDDSGSSQNIAQLAEKNENLSVLESALERFPDLATTLSSGGDYTVFAPTDDAFESLLTTVGQSSLDDIPDDVLREILEYHVLSTSYRSTELTSTSVATVGVLKILLIPISI